ncbi:hypothetical protein [Marvinbryantia formatexigens]|nr:hypothetical protein [Marvinbryantia formatexigens]UWO25259.1 hypothetical protein NQ534_01845 [Marvinbryantia formatexigens DSM 14469]SDH03966.1 hypothetical protein SAMN05660368_03729 [Marvinbryantia formatexigens]
MIQNEYRFNRHFREYVNRYAREHGITPEEALMSTEVQQAARFYSEV